MRTWSNESTARPIEREPRSRSWLRLTPGASSGTANAVTPRAFVVVSVRANSIDVGEHAHADAGLLPRDHVLVAVTHRATNEIGGVGADARLGERDGHDGLTADDAGQPPLLHLVGAVLADDLPGQSGQLQRVRARKVAARDLLHRDAGGQQVGFLAAVLGRRAETEQAELAHLPPRARGELAAPVPVLGARGQLLPGETAQRADQLVLLGGERKIHGSVRSAATEAHELAGVLEDR